MKKISKRKLLQKAASLFVRTCSLMRTSSISNRRFTEFGTPEIEPLECHSKGVMAEGRGESGGRGGRLEQNYDEDSSSLDMWHEMRNKVSEAHVSDRHKDKTYSCLDAR